MTDPLSADRLAEIRGMVAGSGFWRELSMKDTREIALDLLDCIDALQERIDALEAERAYVRDMALLAYTAQAELRMDTPEDEATRLQAVATLRDGLALLGVPVQENDR